MATGCSSIFQCHWLVHQSGAKWRHISLVYRSDWQRLCRNDDRRQFQIHQYNRASSLLWGIWWLPLSMVEVKPDVGHAFRHCLCTWGHRLIHSYAPWLEIETKKNTFISSSNCKQIQFEVMFMLDGGVQKERELFHKLQINQDIVIFLFVFRVT